ncbi:hypothetical protein [Rhodothermus profundi]|uniref:Uncharacterized protein n=1 Tax=Rhodothermus profundi TaxID=633813 RepID=A0A1M6XB73_9BACT|nr:hypothetical protein [Rhodothermus profundi]SHL03035.1 hypothetical protein SAMN04488087_2570 [Rhodothermus profundi]
MARSRLFVLWLSYWVLSVGCRTDPQHPATLFELPINLAHLEHLSEDVVRGDSVLRLVHIYAEAPDYRWVDDPDEGAACVDDAARAAVLYLRLYELTGNDTFRHTAEKLLRFVLYMQRADGLFYNFVYSNQLDINTTHPNSRAEPFGWWASRAVWALGMAADVLQEANPALASQAARAARRALVHLDRTWLVRYPRTRRVQGRLLPEWLVYRYGADASSELLLGLIRLQNATPDTMLARMIRQLAEGMQMMQYGSMARHPYGAHASWIDTWHGWGNAQTQALAAAGYLQSARYEAEHFYPRLLVYGWMYAMSLDDSTRVQRYEQIAYAVRCVAVGLIRLYEQTGEVRYAILAGLAASWLTGNNEAGVPMYDPATGRGYDGIRGPGEVNYNAGAESTIEALYTLLEVYRHEPARRWLYARGTSPVEVTRDGVRYAYRVFRVQEKQRVRSVAVVLNLSAERLELLEGKALQQFLLEVGRTSGQYEAQAYATGF